MQIILAVFGGVFFLIGLMVLFRALKSSETDSMRLYRAAAGAFLVGSANLLFLKNSLFALLLFLGGVMLVLRTKQAE